MFNTLASYLLGSSSNSDTGNKSTDDNKDLNESTKQLNIIATNCSDDEVDDWLLVDKEEGDSGDSVSQTDSEEELNFVEIKNVPQFRGRHSRNNSGAGSRDGLLSLSPTSILPNSMEESWFVTPPPCFTSTGPINMETSPLENLLIEHPSMSVYHSIRNMLPAEDEDLLLDLGLEPLHPAPKCATLNIGPYDYTVSTACHGYQHVERLERMERLERLNHQQVKEHLQVKNSHKGQQIKDNLLVKNSQKNHDRKSRQNICRNALDRCNKVREANIKRGPQIKRKDMNPSKVLSRW